MVNQNVNPLFDLPTRKARGVEWTRVTPEVAQHWLTFNHANRHIVLGKLHQFQTDMERGAWLNDGAPIRFAPNKLLDGQHRLTALIQVGLTLPMVVIYGLEDETQVNMDTGRGRSPVDVLTIEGLSRWEAVVFGTAVHPLISHERGLPLSTSVRYINRDARNFYLENIDAVQRTLRVLGTVPRHPTPLTFARAATCHFLFSQKDPETADLFFSRLYEGEGITKTQPVYHLRNRLLNDAMTKVRRSPFEEYFAIIRAWNATRKRGSWKSGVTMYPGKENDLPEIA